MSTRSNYAKLLPVFAGNRVFDTYLVCTVNSEIFARSYFRETSHMRSFVKIESSRNGEITQSFSDIGTSCPSREVLTPQICLLTLFAKIKFSRKFPDLQYHSDIKRSRSLVLYGFRSY